MNDAEVQVIYRDVDQETNTVRVTLEVPKGTDLEIAKEIFLEAVKNMQEDYR
nr:MAG TPA: hypothetical protein [Caudoviricetes sp.]